MELADDRLPMSDDLLHRIINSFAAATTAVPSAHLSLLLQTTRTADSEAGCASSLGTESKSADSGDVSTASRAAAVSLLPPVRRMTPAEQRLLSDVIRHDTVMRDAIHHQQWDVAASRWNSFIQRCSSDSLATRTLHGALHATHGDVLQSAVAAIDKRREADVEHDIIRMRESMPQLHLEYVSASAQPFSSYEDAVLQQLVHKFSSHHPAGRKKVDWSSLTTSWLYRHHSEVEARLTRRLLLRDKIAIKSHWQALLHRQRAVTPPDDIAAASAESSSPASSPTAVSMEDNAEEPDAGIAAASASQPTSALSTFGSWLHLSFLPQPSSHSQSSQSPSSSSSQPLPHSLATVPPLLSPPAALVPAAHSPIKGHWPPKATQRFNALREAAVCSGIKWSYDEFSKVWPAQLYGYVSRERWGAKNRTEKNKRQRAAAAASESSV